MRTTRERTTRDITRERGIVGLVLLALMVVAIAASAFFFVARKQNEKAASSDTETTAPSEDELEFSQSTPLQRNAVNTQRRSDASTLVGAALEYINNNNGYMPTEVTANMTAGFDYYKTASIASGEQAAVAVDELRLVTGAQCGKNGATIVYARGVAAQYGLRDPNKEDPVFTPACIDL